MRTTANVQNLAPPSRFTADEVAWLRVRLIARMSAQLDDFETWAKRLAACERGSSTEAIALERAVAAVHAYQARELVEELEAALDRIDTGRYGLCEGCGQELPLPLLTALPHVQVCRGCEPGSSRSVLQQQSRGDIRDDPAGTPQSAGSSRFRMPVFGLVRDESHGIDAR
jgi:RNA polymerase-binding transcription factor DksA